MFAAIMDMGTRSHPSMSRYKDEEFKPNHFDAIIPRIGASVTFYGTAVVRQFEMMGTYCVNESVAISTFPPINYALLQLLSRKGVGHTCAPLLLIQT